MGLLGASWAFSLAFLGVLGATLVILGILGLTNIIESGQCRVLRGSASWCACTADLYDMLCSRSSWQSVWPQLTCIEPSQLELCAFGVAAAIWSLVPSVCDCLHPWYRCKASGASDLILRLGLLGLLGLAWACLGLLEPLMSSQVVFAFLGPSWVDLG